LEDNTPTSGLGEYDETSYVEPQEHWGESDEDLHKILDSQGREIMFMPERPADLRGIDRPGNWVYGGYLLLDQYNHPVRTWPNVNRALSSELEGFRLEALTRLYPGFTTQE